MSSSDPIAALVLPFEKGLLTRPERAFLIRAEADEALRDWRETLVCEQSFKPFHDALVRDGYHAVAWLEGSFAAGFCLLTKHRAENRANLARAWALLEPGGLLLVSGSNTLGAASLERELDKAAGLDDHLSKHQSRVFWLRRADGPMPEAMTEWLAAASPHPVGDTGMVARAGSFSHDHVDPGTRILIDHFPDEIAGRVADLGAGWGALDGELLRRFPAITGLDLYEAEALALDDARSNLGDDSRVAYHWHDVAAGLPDVAPYDWIVSNPPFHEGRKADPGIGQAFINTAWKSIRRRGKFLLVANAQLPYEAALRKRFRKVEQLFAGEGFKVFLSSDRYDKVMPERKS